MPEISSEIQRVIDNLEKASDGSTMRRAIIDALIAVNENGGNATTLNGMYTDQLANKSANFEHEFKMLTKLLDEYDEIPKKNRIALVQSGNISNYLDTLHKRLISIDGGALSKGTKTIAATLKILNNIKKDLADAIGEKGGTIDPLDSFEDYAKAIKNLKIYDILDELTVTENTGDDPIKADTGKGWNVVHVNIQPRVEPLVITEEGDYDVEDYPNIDAWNPVTVQVNGLTSESGSGGYNPSSSGSGSSSEIPLEHMDITSNGSYTAPTGKAIGSAYVEVNEQDINKLALEKFTVTFENYDGKMLDQQFDVQGGSAVVYQGTEIPSKDTHDGTIWTFSHWDPNPDFVDHDMTCVAQFSEAAYGMEDSTLSWEDICNGSPAPVGTIKVLNFLPYKGVQLTSVRMKCVSTSEGKGGTWVSMDLIDHKMIQMMCDAGLYCLGTNGYGSDVSSTGPTSATSPRCSVNPLPQYFVGDKYNSGTFTSGTQIGNRLGWLNSPLRVWLNTEFKDKCIPPMIRESIKPVNKSFYTIWNNSTSDKSVANAFDTMLKEGYGENLKALVGGSMRDGTNYIRNQSIWIPSTRELWRAYSKDYKTLGTADLKRYSENRSLGLESEGVIYDQVYGEVIEFTENDWANNRATVVNDIYSNPGQYEILKHLYYYPYDDFIEARRPLLIYGASGSSWSGTYNYTEDLQCREWPTRTCYGGSMFSLNPFGSNKRDMSAAVDEILPGNLVRLTDGPWVHTGNMSRWMPVGICFGFVL